MQPVRARDLALMAIESRGVSDSWAVELETDAETWAGVLLRPDALPELYVAQRDAGGGGVANGHFRGWTVRPGRPAFVAVQMEWPAVNVLLTPEPDRVRTAGEWWLAAVSVPRGPWQLAFRSVDAEGRVVGEPVVAMLPR